jgi:TP901 family phage tail tape measure protein
MASAARQVALETTFAADQAAEAFFFLASAGLDAEQSIAAMPQVAKFAQAGMFDMALATDLATDAQSALGLSSKDATENLENLTRITDVFVRANTLANTSVEQLAVAFTTKAGTALKTVGKDV